MKNIEPIPIYTQTILTRLYLFFFNKFQTLLSFLIDWVKIRQKRHRRVMDAAKRGDFDKIYRQRLYDTLHADYKTIQSFSIRIFFKKHFLSWQRVLIYFLIITFLPWFIFIWGFLMLYKFIMRYFVVLIDILVFEWLVFLKYVGSFIVFIYIFSRDLFLVLFYWSLFRYPRLVYDWFSAKKSEDWWLMILMPFVYFTAWFWDTVVWAYGWLYWVFHWMQVCWWQLQWYKYRYDIKVRPLLFKWRHYIIDYLKYQVKLWSYQIFQVFLFEIIIEFWIIEILIRFFFIDVVMGFLIYDLLFRTILVKILFKYILIEIIFKYALVEVIFKYGIEGWLFSFRLYNLIFLNFYYLYLKILYIKCKFYQPKWDLFRLLVLRIFKHMIKNLVVFFVNCLFWWAIKKIPLLKRIIHYIYSLFLINKLYYWRILKLKTCIPYLKFRYYFVLFKSNCKLFISTIFFLDYKRYYRFVYYIYIYVDASITLYHLVKNYKLDFFKNWKKGLFMFILFVWGLFFCFFFFAFGEPTNNLTQDILCSFLISIKLDELKLVKAEIQLQKDNLIVCDSFYGSPKKVSGNGYCFKRQAGNLNWLHFMVENFRFNLEFFMKFYFNLWYDYFSSFAVGANQTATGIAILIVYYQLYSLQLIDLCFKGITSKLLWICK